MKKFTALMTGLALAALVGSAAYAGCGSCAGHEKKAEQAGCAEKTGCGDKAGCTDKCLKDLNLTAEQQAEVKKLTAACTELGCDEAGQKKMMEGLKKILSEEQFAKMKAHCAKSGCWAKEKAAGPAASLTTLQYACGGSCGDKDTKDDGKQTTDA